MARARPAQAPTLDEWLAAQRRIVNLVRQAIEAGALHPEGQLKLALDDFDKIDYKAS